MDLEGVLIPEIWICPAEATGLSELRRTTREEPDYGKLMTWRLGFLREHHLGLPEIRKVIDSIIPFHGARAFLDALRDVTQVVLLTDSFRQFAAPVMEKLGKPTLFCNSLEIAPSGEITGYTMRAKESKLATVSALQSVGFDTIACGDSYNDVAMLRASKAGFFFRTPAQIQREFPMFPAFEAYDDLLNAI